MNNDNFDDYVNFESKIFYLATRFCAPIESVVLLLYTVQQILLKRSISSKGHHLFLMDFIWIRSYDALRAKSMFLIKSAIQYNNSMIVSVVALYGAHLHVITPRQLA